MTPSQALHSRNHISTPELLCKILDSQLLVHCHLWSVFHCHCVNFPHATSVNARRLSKIREEVKDYILLLMYSVS